MRTYHKEMLLLLLSLGAGLLFALGMLVAARMHGLNVVELTGDSRGYMELAENLLTQHSLGLFENNHFYFESFRSPGYPAFLSFLFFFLHDWNAVLLVHVLLTSIAPVLLYLLCRPYHERAAWWGSIIFALEPTRLFLTASLLSDALFTCLFLGSLILLERGRRESAPLSFLLCGVLLGVSILVRPIAQFLPLLYAGYIVLTGMPRDRAIKGALVLTVTSFLIVFPWMLRNHRLFHSWSISSVGAANLILYNAPAYLTDHPNPEGKAVLASFQAEQKTLSREEGLSLKRSGVFTSTFRETIRGHEISYVLFHVVKVIPFFVTDGLREIVRMCGVNFGTPPNISSLIFAGNVHAIVNYLRAGGLAIALLILGSGFFLWAFLSFVYSALRILQGKVLTRTALFLVMVVAYFAFLTGPVSNARYRNPVTGIIIVLALCVYMDRKAVAPTPVIH
jgi:hypothetical protein